MALLRTLTGAGLVALVAAEDPRRLGFDFSGVSIDTNGQNPLSMMSSAMSNAQTQFANSATSGSSSSSSDTSSDSDSGFSDNPFDNFAALTSGSSPAPPPASNNNGLGGPDLNSETGSDIMQGMIKSFLANKQLESGEEQCLEQGCGAVGSSAAQVSQQLATLAGAVSAQTGGTSVSSSMSSLLGGSAATSAPVQATEAPTDAPTQAPVQVAATTASPAAESAATAFGLFGASQGRRLQAGMDPTMMIGMAGNSMQVAQQVQHLASLGQQVMDKCLQSDGKQMLQTAAENAKDPQYLAQSMSANGITAAGTMAAAKESWESGDASGFGSNVGTALREVFLSSDTSGSLPEGLPDKSTLGNVTGGMLDGFFGSGSTATITTPETSWTIDMDKCVGNNLPLMQYMYSNLFSGLAKAASGSTVSTSSSAFSSSSSGSSSQATSIMMTMMQMPNALKQCGIGSEQEEALKDAFASATMPSVDMNMPDSGSMSSTDAVQAAASTASAYSQLVADPSTATSFGESLGKNLQSVLSSVSNKYYVDKSGRLRKRLTVLSATTGVFGGATSMIAPLLLAMTLVLIGLALIAVKRRHAAQVEQRFLDLEDAQDPVE